MIGQDFPKMWLDIAREKLEKSQYNDTYLTVSRHAIDMYSKRFLGIWLKRGQISGDGLATFLVKHAEIAWKEGEDVSKRRHQHDGIVKSWEGICFVFNLNENFTDYKELITVYGSDD